MKRPQLYPGIPNRCRHVLRAMLGQGVIPGFVRKTGTWRYVDVTVATGKNSSARRLRLLRELRPDLVRSRLIPTEDGHPYRVFWIDRRCFRKERRI